MARVSIGCKAWPQGVDWATIDATWAAGGELDVFDAAWGNDHLTDPNLAHGGSSLEALTMIAALAHHVPGQIATGLDARSRAAARELALTFVAAGATHLILGLPAHVGPEGLRAVAREVAEPIRQALG